MARAEGGELRLTGLATRYAGLFVQSIFAARLTLLSLAGLAH